MDGRDFFSGSLSDAEAILLGIARTSPLVIDYLELLHCYFFVFCHWGKLINSDFNHSSDLEHFSNNSHWLVSLEWIFFLSSQIGLTAVLISIHIVNWRILEENFLTQLCFILNSSDAIEVVHYATTCGWSVGRWFLFLRFRLVKTFLSHSSPLGWVCQF